MKDSFSWKLNRFFLKCPRAVCQFYELCRLAAGKIFAGGIFRYEHTPCWYNYCARQDDGGKKVKYSVPDIKNPLELPGRDWFHLARPFRIHEHISFNFDAAIEAYPQLKGIAFIFFMGAGDYLYASPIFPELKNKYPHIDFIALAGDKNDRNNSALVAQLLKTNPCFSSVGTYPEGRRHPVIWKNYDYRAALENVPKDYLAVPVYYDYSVKASHRVHSLFETYGLPLPAGGNTEETPAPVMYFPGEPSEAVKEYCGLIEKMCGMENSNAENSAGKDIVFLQLDSRGSNYTYPYIRRLAQMLSAKYAVLSVTTGIAGIEGCLEIDIKKLPMNDTFRLLSMLSRKHKVSVISVNSVFWAASAGLHLPNLGLQHWHDPKLHNLWYSNITFLTDMIYEKIPRKYQIQAGPECWKRHNKKIIDFLPEFIYKNFHS